MAVKGILAISVFLNIVTTTWIFGCYALANKYEERAEMYKKLYFLERASMMYKERYYKKQELRYSDKKER